MITVVTPDVYKDYKAELCEMHRLRHRIFHDRLGWEVTSVNGEERDEFDTLSPVYLLAFDDAHFLMGSWRLLPTTGPYMLNDTFPQLLEDTLHPHDPHVWECSRFCIDWRDGRENNLAAINRFTSELFCGLVEYCLSEGIRQIISVYDIRIARMLPRVGCPPKWKTRSQVVGKSRALVGLFEANVTVLNRVRAAGGITHSVLHYPTKRTDQAA